MPAPVDDFLAACDRFDTKRALAAPATRPARHTDWSNAQSFIDGGYLARVLRQHCRGCDSSTESVEGIFHAEIKAGTAARRLTALPRGAQWPLADGLPLEVVSRDVDWCADCLRSLGFTSERPAGADWIKGA